MRPTIKRLSGGAQYPYPKEVWSPSGGWWTRPSQTWKANTMLAAVGLAGVSYAIWMLSANNERRHAAPTRWIPSMLWAKQFTSGEMGIREGGASDDHAEESHH